MGLDMYLYASIYLSTYDPKEARIAQQIKPIFIMEGFDLPEPKFVKWEVGYWRKANAIHRWFVDNVQAGNDDCGHHYVGRERLEELRHRCLGALLARKKKDKHIKVTKEDRAKIREYDPGEGLLYGLEPTSGFFFGSTEIDDGYYDDLNRTVRTIDTALPLFAKGLDFEYHSSW